MEMKKNPKPTDMYKNILPCMILVILLSAALCSCEHEIDFDYPTAEAKVIIEGQVSTEDVMVRISHTRPMGDNSKDQAISDAQVWVSSDDGYEEQLVYDQDEQCYKSATGMVGSAGHTYHLKAIVDGQQYTSKSTMPLKAQVDSVFFRYIEALDIRMYFVCIQGVDPIPNERNYYLMRLMRGDEIFRWNPRSGRSNVDGIFEYDIICSSEKDMEKGIDDNGKIPLMDGDTIEVVAMSIERPAWLYFQSLVSSTTTASNPITNIEGGAQGVFMAPNITRPEAIVFDKETVKGNKDKR